MYIHLVIFFVLPNSKEMSVMKKSVKPIPPRDTNSNSSIVLEDFFFKSLHELYYAECQIAKEFDLIQSHICSQNLKEILKNHFAIHLKHKARLEKIFRLKGELIELKNCITFNALLAEGLSHLSFFSEDIANWEIGLILVAQKLTHYKIASYGGLAHLAINLDNYKAAALLAFSAQEEEEFLANNLNGIIDAFLSSHVEGYKN